jgi:hypothetical protein
MNNTVNGPQPTGMPHKFFERYLDNNLEDLQSFLEEKYKLIKDAELFGVKPIGEDDYYWMESGSLSTVKWREYNVFQLYHPAIRNLYKGLSDTVKEACQYYGIDFEKQQYYVQGWFNINHADVGKLDWHDHGGPFAPHFHGYYCVNAEPSITHYKLFNDDSMLVDNVNKNNRLVVSEMGHPHAMGDWTWGGPRITIAYDIEPLSEIMSNDMTIQQHWIPLL